MKQYIRKIHRSMLFRCPTYLLAALLWVPTLSAQADIWEEMVLEYGMGGRIGIPVKGIIGQTIMKSFILEIFFTEPKLGGNGWYWRAEIFYTANCRSYDYHPRWTRRYDSQNRVVEERAYDPAITVKRAYFDTPMRKAIHFACSNGGKT